MNATNRPQRLYRYVIDHDKGFAPNPFFGVCTLACCKPDIRKHAALGDMIVGFGPKKYGLGGKIIYWMTVSEIIDFDTYWNDPRYIKKRPKMGGSLSLCFGDNIYHRSPEDKSWIQEQSFHSDENSLRGLGNLKRDTGTTENVLVASEYSYWGGSGPATPSRFQSIIKEGRGYQFNVDDENLKNDFIEWLLSMPDRGFRNDPADWSHDKQIRQQLTAVLS